MNTDTHSARGTCLANRTPSSLAFLFGFSVILAIIMLKSMLAKIGIGLVAAVPISAMADDGPYREHSTNLIYQLLFCDRLELFKNNYSGEVVYPWSVLFSGKAGPGELAKIANGQEQESRVRILACNALRAGGQPVPKKVYFGTIIEVGLEGGLDTLAVFADGRARYINQSGKIIVVEGSPNPFEAEIVKVIDTSKPIVAAIGPWEKDRLPAPKQGDIRMTFLVSDGLYFGQGPMRVMQHDAKAQPLIWAATNLLLKLVQQTPDRPGGASATQPIR